MGLHVRNQIMIKILPHKNCFVLCNCATRYDVYKGIYVSSVTPQDTQHNNHFELPPFAFDTTVINIVSASPSTGCLHGFKT